MTACMAVAVQVSQRSSRLFVNGTFIRTIDRSVLGRLPISFDLNTIASSVHGTSVKIVKFPWSK